MPTKSEKMRTNPNKAVIGMTRGKQRDALLILTITVLLLEVYWLRNVLAGHEAFETGRSIEVGKKPGL